MALATFEDVMVDVAGLPPESVVSLGITDDGLVIGGYGMLAWCGSQVWIEDRAPQGLRIRIAPATGAPTTFFVPVRSLPDAASIPVLAIWLECSAAQAGATVETAFSSV